MPYNFSLAKLRFKSSLARVGSVKLHVKLRSGWVALIHAALLLSHVDRVIRNEVAILIDTIAESQSLVYFRIAFPHRVLFLQRKHPWQVVSIASHRKTHALPICVELRI